MYIYIYIKLIDIYKHLLLPRNHPIIKDMFRNHSIFCKENSQYLGR
jgi:hypothetical protein